MYNAGFLESLSHIASPWLLEACTYLVLPGVAVTTATVEWLSESMETNRIRRLEASGPLKMNGEKAMTQWRGLGEAGRVHWYMLGRILQPLPQVVSWSQWVQNECDQ